MITNHKECEEKWRDSREYIQAVLDSINDAIFVDDANTGQIIDVNRRMCEMYGYSREEALSLNVGQLSAGGEPYFQDNALKWLQKARNEGPQIFEWLAKKRSGAVFWVEVSIRFAVIGGQDRFLVSVRDITDRKQTERIIVDSKNELQQVYDSVPVMICQLNPDRKVIEANAYFRSFTGWPDHPISLSEKACGVLGCINSLDDPRGCGFGTHCKICALRLAIRETLKTGHKHTGIEYKTILLIDDVKKDIVLLCSTALIQKNNQKVVLLSMVDITERKQTEEALQRSLQEKETLLRELHHRVKNNLAAIISLLELQQDRNGDPQNRSLLAEMGSRIRSMALVHEMLYRSAHLSEIDFDAYLQALVEHLRGSFDPRGVIRISVAAAGVRMNLDTAIPCGLIVNELVINALKYAFPAEQPGVGANEITVTVVCDQLTYTLIVADNGVGLPIDLDWTTTRTLGLRLVRMLGQHQLQGSIELDRSTGVRFLLRFGPRQDRSISGEQGQHSDRRG